MGLAEVYLSKYINVWASAADSWKNKSSVAYPGYSRMAEALRNKSFTGMIDDYQALVGSPEMIIENLNFLYEKLKVDQMLWQIDFGSQPFEVSMQTLNLLTDKVIPAIG